MGTALFLLAAGTAQAVTFLGPSPYLSSADSPFAADITAGTVVLDTFESGGLSVSGVSGNVGGVIGPGGITDSVDADDGTIDGLGVNGRSWFSGSGAAGVRFTFAPDINGKLPTRAGIVWTDGAGAVSFEAFGPGDAPLGTFGPFDIADGTFASTTAEDRFFGAINDAGISSIFVSNVSGGIELDHLQFGIGAGPGTPAPVPEPLAIALLPIALLAMGLRSMRGRTA